MSNENAAAEVAEDFKTALEDMISISRIEIMNLCQIARENTEYAYEISEVLVTHINRTPPQKKLAALYVLDAIVKNVGTPYTLYVAPKLYSTFMESYARVEKRVRQKMEEMLTTWKGPVPGSGDTKPVFPPNVVLPIEKALIKAHNAAMQIEQSRKGQPHVLGRPPPGVQHRNTPTPPGAAPGPGQTPTPAPNGVSRGTPQQQQNPFQPPGSGTHQAAAPFYGHDPLAAAQQQHQQQQQQQHQPGYGASADVSADVLNRNIQDLIVATGVECAQNPHDVGAQTRLKALVDLQAIVQGKNLPHDQLVLVKKQVDELAVKLRVSTQQHHVQQQHQQHQHQHQQQGPTPVGGAAVLPPVAPAGLSVAPASASATPVPLPGQAAPISIDSILGKGALATLLAQQNNPSRHSTPAVPTPPPAAPAVLAQPPAPNPMDVIQQLRQAGLLGAGIPPPPVPPASAVAPPAAPPPASAPPGVPSALSSLPPVLARVLSPMKPWTPPAPAADPSGVSWDLGSLQAARPWMNSSIYSDLGPQCSQCGRRFKTDAEGKKKKTAHMDWHFRVRQRMVEAEKRGQYRSHYVPKSDWIKSREEVDIIYTAEEKDASAAEKDAPTPPEQQYIPVPDPASGVGNVCPICQERFENKWLDAAQEWVWLDARLVGGRVYHASCHAEAAKDRDRAGTPGFGGGGGGRGYTPEPVLGKRKAEGGADVSALKKGRG